MTQEVSGNDTLLPNCFQSRVAIAWGFLGTLAQEVPGARTSASGPSSTETSAYDLCFVSSFVQWEVTIIVPTSSLRLKCNLPKEASNMASSQETLAFLVFF